MTRPMTGAPLERMRAVKRRGEVLRGLLAGLFAIAVVAGVPTALVVLVGNPIPTLRGGGLLHLSPPADVAVQAAACLCWIGWAQLATCLAVEAAAGIRGTGLPWRVPFAFGVQQDLARAMVTPTLLIAAPRQGLRSAPHPTAGPVPPAPPPAPPAPPAHPVWSPPTTAAPPGPPPAVTPVPSPSSPPSTVSLVSTVSAGPSAAGTAAVAGPPGRPEPRHETAPARAAEVPWDIAGAELLAAGLLDTLDAMRRQRARRRRPGAAAVLPDAGAAAVDMGVRLGADRAAADFLDRALRALARGVSRPDCPVPEVYAARLSTRDLELLVATPLAQAPPPFTAEGGGTRWRVARDAALPPVDGVAAPLPGLVSLGTDGAGRLLVDLESVGGPVSVDGDRDGARSLVAAAALELVTSRWSDQAHVTLVGFGSALAPIDPLRLHCVDNLDDALDAVYERLERIHGALAAIGTGSVLTGRLHGTDSGCHATELLMLAGPPSSGQLARLGAHAQRFGRAPLGILAAGEVPAARLRLTVDARGVLTTGALGRTVAAQLLTPRSYIALGRLLRLRSADGERPEPRSDRPVGAAGGSPVGPGADAGHDTHADTHADTDAGTDAAAGGDDAAGRRTDVAGAESGEDSDVESALSAPVAPPALPHPVDPDAPAGVLLRILGEPALDHVGAPRPASPITVEICARLALAGQLPVRALGAAIWPAGVTVADLDHALEEVVRSLGADPAGEPRLRRVDGVLSLSDDVRLDWHLFVALSRRGGDGDVERALRLVRGALAEPAPPRRYAWLARERVAHEAQPHIVDVAHHHARLCLSRGDHDGAVGAARAGLRAEPVSDVLWEDLAAAVAERDGATAADDLLRGRDPR